MHKSHKHSNCETHNTWATKENTPSSPPNCLPPLQPMSLQETDTCFHLLSKHTNTTITNKAIWQICKLFLFHSTTQDTLLMNACTHPEDPIKNTIPIWVYPCLCTTRPCHYLAILKHDILIITATFLKKKLHYIVVNPSLNFIEFTFCQDHDPTTTTQW